MTSEPAPSRPHWWTGLLLATAIGAAVRFAGIAGQSFWYDEAYSARIAETATTWELFTGVQRDNGNPPLYYIVHRWATGLFGSSEAGQRTFAALCGVLTIPILGLLGRRLGDPRTGLIAAGLFAVSPLSVELSNEARVYSWLHLITALDALLLLKWLDSQKWRDGVAYLVVTALACYSHYFIVFFVLSHLVAVLAAPNRRQAFWRWCLMMTGVAVLWGAWVPAFWDQLRTPGNLSRMADAWMMQFASTPIVFGLGRTFAWRDAGPWMLGLAAAVAVLAFCLPALWGWLRLLHRRRPDAVLLAGWVLFPIAIPLIVALLKSPIYHHRYGSVALPGFVCLVALGIRSLPAALKPAVVGAIGAATLYSLTNYYTQPIKDDWRSASRAVLAGNTGEIVLTDQEIEVLPLMYYAAQAGRVPPEMYGLAARSDSDRGLPAFRYDCGQKQDREPIDHADRILAAPSLCLALCVPEQPLEHYRRLFESHGYRLASEERFYRITVARFERQTDVAAWGEAARNGSD